MPAEGAETFGRLLRRFRLAAGLSQESLAERARLSVESISALERGVRRTPYRSTVDLLAAGLALSDVDRGVLAGTALRGRGPRNATPEAPAGLPQYSTSFIDRERERREVEQLLTVARIVTVCGPGGVGKTRLTLEVCRTSARRVRFVDFAALHDPALVAGRIASALGLSAIAPQRALGAIVASLGSSDVVLIFDNCEHVVETCAHMIEAIVRGCTGVRIVCTSREPLLVDGEAIYRLDPFIEAQPSIALFLERADAASPEYSFAADHRTIESIARSLDGMPLAIELAAALARTHSVTEIAQTLPTAAFLAGASRRTSIEHQRSMEATLAWSYALLGDAERSALRVLAYPAAGTSREALDAVCGQAGATAVRRLIDASLVFVQPPAGRIKLHAMTRNYVASVTGQAEATIIARRYACWLGTQMRAAFDVGWCTMSYAIYVPLADELDNLRQALHWALTDRDAEIARDLASAPDYWTAIVRTPEGYRWLTRIDTELEAANDDPREATLLFGIALCAAQSGLAQEAREPGRRAAAAARRHGATRIEGRCAIALGNSLLALGDARAAAASHAAAVALFEATNDKTGCARALSFRALALIELGAGDEAKEIVAHVMRLYAELPNQVGATEELVVEMLLADIARLRGDVATALDRTREAAALLGDGHRTWIHLRVLHQHIDALVAAGDHEQALATGVAELDRLHERGFATDVALLIERLAIVLARTGHVHDAARAAGFTERTFSAAGRSRMFFDRQVRATLVAELNAALTCADLAALQHEGRYFAAAAFIDILRANVPARH